MTRPDQLASSNASALGAPRGVWLLSALVLVGCAAAFAAEPNSLTEQEKRDGWRSLFDGKTVNGWRGYKTKEAPSGWQVEDGILKRVAKGGDLMTNGRFDFFELSLQWNTPRGGNSGIIYRVAETEGASYTTGPEIQIIDRMSPDNKHSAGSCYALFPPTKDVLKPSGQWNHLRLVIHPDNHVEHHVNGEKICEYVIGSDNWNTRVAASKFGKMPRFGKVTKGHICLQDHGAEIWFRNLKIRSLK